MNHIQFYHRILLPDGTYTNGSCVHGPDGGDWPSKRFGIPEDLKWKTVLDIGAWDGFFSLECEKRGAEKVVATNAAPPKGASLAGLLYAIDKLDSKVIPALMDIERVDVADDTDPYDVVMFYGVLYHLKSPLVAMENVAKFTKTGGVCLLETAMAMDYTLVDSPVPVLEYSPGFAKDPTNHFYPNRAWIEAAANYAGFKSVEHVFTVQSRSTFRLTK